MTRRSPSQKAGITKSTVTKDWIPPFAARERDRYAYIDTRRLSTVLISNDATPSSTVAQMRLPTRSLTSRPW